MRIPILGTLVTLVLCNRHNKDDDMANMSLVMHKGDELVRKIQDLINNNSLLQGIDSNK